jgi:hypothetical protein
LVVYSLRLDNPKSVGEKEVLILEIAENWPIGMEKIDGVKKPIEQHIHHII